MAGRDLTRLLRQFRQTAAGDGLSDAQLLERFVATGDEAAFEVLSPLFVGLADETGFPHEGTVASLDDRVNPVTGTIRVRGAFRNPDRQFLPGMFARVRMQFGKPRPVLEVPEDAVATGQGAYVLVVNDKNVVERRPVRVGEQDGRRRVIWEGLRPDDWVVIEGILSLRPGETVDPRRVAPAKE